MILAALFAAQVAPLPPAEPAPRDIEVIGRRLDKLRLDIGLAGGQITGCRVAVKSGDRLIDDEACKGAYACVRRGVVETRRLLHCIDNHISSAVLHRDAFVPIS